MAVIQIKIGAAAGPPPVTPDDLAAEALIRSNADDALGAAIDGEATARAAAVATEATARATADAALTTAIALKADQTEVDAMQPPLTEASQAAASLRTALSAAGSNLLKLTDTDAHTTVSTSQADDYPIFEFAKRTSQLGFIDAIQVDLSRRGVMSKLRVTVYRLAEAATSNATAAADPANRTQLGSPVVVRGSDVYGWGTAFQVVTIPIPSIAVAENDPIIVRVEPLGSSLDPDKAGFGAGVLGSGEEAFLCGFYAPPHSSTVQPLTGSKRVWGELLISQSDMDPVAVEMQDNETCDTGRAVASAAWIGSSYTPTASPSDYAYWGVGAQLDRPVYPRAWRMWLSQLIGVDALRFQFYARPAPAGIGAASELAGPGVYAGDILLIDQTYAPSDLIGYAPVINPVTVDFPLTSLDRLDTGFIYLALVTGMLDGSPAVIGCGQAAPDSDIADWARGYFATIHNPTVGVVGSSTNVAFELIENAVVPIAERGRFDPAAAELTILDAYARLQTGTSIALPAMRLDKSSGAMAIPAQSIAVPAVASASITDEATTLHYLDDAEVSYKTIGDVVVKKTSDSSVLVEGTDYRVSADRGSIIGLKNVAAFAIKVSFTGYEHRYDLITVHPITGIPSLTQGTSRKLDPVEYPATQPVNSLAAFRVYRTHEFAELIPVGLFRDFVRQSPDGRARHLAWLESARKALPRTLAKLNRGLPLRMGIDGDSITAMGGRAVAQNLTPGGPGRDIIGYFSHYPSDTKALMTLYDFGDGAGTVHVKESWGWRVAANLQARFGSPVTLRNWAIAGTDTSNGSFVDSADSQTYYDLTHATRLAARTADGLDVMFALVGMNDGDLAETLTYLNCVAYARAMQAAGTEVVFLTTPRVNTYWGGRDRREWERLSADIIRAARDTCSAYVPLFDLIGDGNEGAIGLSINSLGAATLTNHPGRTEHHAFGDFTSLIFSATNAPPAGAVPTSAVREVLTGARTYYVRTDGSDTNTGRANTAAAGFLTIQHALNVVQGLDLGGQTVTISVADGTYSGTVALSGPWIGAGQVEVIGNLTTPANVLLNAATTIMSLSNRAWLRVKGCKFTSSGGSAISLATNSYLEFGVVDFGACTSGRHLAVQSDSKVLAVGAYTISGGAIQHLLAQAGSYVEIRSRTVTLTGTPAFTTFAAFLTGAGFTADSNTYSGSATGARYQVERNAWIDTNGGGASYFPGSTAGSTATGGNYA